MSLICVTVGRGRHRSLLEEWAAAAEAGAQLVELRLDCLRREPDLKRILKHRYSPCIITIRRGVDGGLWRGDEEKRQRILREAILAGVEYVDLEVDIARSIPRYGKTKRIVSYHNFKATPPELEEYVHQMEESQADVVKFATMAQTLSDGARILKLMSEAKKAPTIGIAMGELGAFTRLVGAKYGAPFTYAGFNPDRQFAPGQPRLPDLLKDYLYNQIDRDTELYAVIGDPIGHSLSPAVHNNAFRALGMNKAYVPLLIPAGRLKESLEELAILDIRGFSVTIPHKEEIVPLLAKKDGAVERTGSCNTVVVDEPGQWVGYNTDYRAAMDALEQALGGPGDGDLGPLANKQCLILGSGGVARSIAFGLERRGAGVILCNRHDERAGKLAQEVGCRQIEWTARASTLADVLINCTPVGMHPEVDETPMPPAGFKPGMLVFDTVYHPEQTMFIKLARERECKTVTGVEMFVRQAELQFKLFTGQDPPEGLMASVVRRKITALREE